MSELVHCGLCDESFDALELIPSGASRICIACMEQREADRKVARGIWLSLLGGPMALVLAYGTLCIPVFSYFAPALFGMWGIVNGVRGIQMSRGLRGREDEMNVTSTATVLHLIVGVACIPIALPPIGVTLLFLALWMFKVA